MCHGYTGATTHGLMCEAKAGHSRPGFSDFSHPRPHRLSVRTSGFHPEKPGSTPGGAAILFGADATSSIALYKRNFRGSFIVERIVVDSDRKDERL